jgi:hypothetical protein
MPTQSEENKQVIQQRYNALVRGDTDPFSRVRTKAIHRSEIAGSCGI